jgi:hypothetical protein
MLGGREEGGWNSAQFCCESKTKKSEVCIKILRNFEKMMNYHIQI